MIPHLVVYVLAVAAIVFWVTAARNYQSSTATPADAGSSPPPRRSPCSSPVVLFIAKWIAVTAIVVLAVVALVILFAERGKL